MLNNSASRLIIDGLIESPCDASEQWCKHNHNNKMADNKVHNK